jgi:FkbM family methyltransferase
MNAFSKISRKIYEHLFAHLWLLRLLRDTKLLPYSIYKHLYFKGTFPVKVSADKHFLMENHGHYVETLLFWGGIEHGWEKASLQLWKALSNDAQFILDIGANTGIYSLLSASVNPQAEIHAFEPINRVYAKLVHNIQMNGFNITAHNLACGNANETTVIYDSHEAHNYMASLVPNAHAHHDASLEQKIEVRTLDSLLNEGVIKGVDLVKIDVEKFEPQVLEGFREIVRLLPDLLIEILNDDIAAAIANIIGDLDYLYFNIDEEKGATQVQALSGSNTYNFLICKPSTAKRLGLV